MKNLLILLGLLIGLLSLLPAQAQRSPFKIKSLEGDDLKPYSESHNGMKRVNTLTHDDWYEVRTTFDLDAEWVDEMTFKYKVLLKGDRLSILAGEVSYQNVPKGNSLPSVMYIHPTTYARLGKVVGMHVEVAVGTRKVGEEEKTASGAPSNWWKAGAEPKRLLKRKDQSPFIAVNSGGYLDIKTDGGR